MKLNRLETHDRLVHFKKDQNDTLQQGADDCLKKNPLSLAMQEKAPYVYIFAHPRTIDFDEKSKLWMSGQFKTWSEIPDKKMMWHPRLIKPEAQTNSYLFRAISKTDVLEICWLIPDEKMWKQYEKGKVTENEIVMWSIDQYINHRADLERRDKDDLPDQRAFEIYRQIAHEGNPEVFTKPRAIPPTNKTLC